MTSGVALLSLLTSCRAGKVDEEVFSLYIGNESYAELVSALHSYSSQQGYDLTTKTLTGVSPETTSHYIMVEENGVRFLIQSALAEQCKEQESRRDVKYSQRVFDVNAFSTSYFRSKADLSEKVIQLKSVLTNAGFRVLPRAESCNLL